jgi:Dolichyl-phosphate-mannose-protein mannosyltransferase
MGSKQARAGSPRRRWWAVFLPLWIASVVYAGAIIRHGWIPHDEGTLAQAAERVLFGEMPHRDFDDVYTGGLAWMNAAAFRVFGTNLWALRIPLMIAFALWVPALFWIATRFTSPPFAAPFVALAVTWSIPIYAAPMPSWYVLFLSTFGTAALLAHRANGRRRWLVAAGVCGGLAVLVKITGLHFVAAALLYFAWCEPAISAREAPGASRAGRVAPLAITALLLAFVASLVVQIWPLALRVGFFGPVLHFVLPGALLAALVGWRAWTVSAAPSTLRIRILIRLALPFLGGFVAPVVVFVAAYVAAGAPEALVQGVLVLPMRRTMLSTASTYAPGLMALVWLVPPAAVAAIPAVRGRAWVRWALVVSGVALFGTVGWSIFDETAYWVVHQMLRTLVPFVTVVGAWRLWQAGHATSTASADQVALVVAVGATLSLVQFPFAAPIYFFYCAPMLALAALAVATLGGASLRERPGVLLLVAVFLASMLAAPMRVGRWQHPRTASRLATDRSGLDLSLTDVREFDQVLALVRAHARGSWVWAGPDAPEIAFLAGLRNPTRTIFDAFDADFEANPSERASRLVRTLDERGVNVVVLSRSPPFSGQLSSPHVEALRARFSKWTVFDRYIVAWRE